MFSVSTVLGLGASLFLLLPNQVVTKGQVKSPDATITQQQRQFALNNLGDSVAVITVDVHQLLSTKVGQLLKDRVAHGLKTAANLGFDSLDSVDFVVAGQGVDNSDYVYFVFGKFEFKKILEKAKGSLKDLPGEVSFEEKRFILKIPANVAGTDLYVTHMNGPGTGFVLSPSRKKLLAVVSPEGLPTKELKPITAAIGDGKTIHFAGTAAIAQQVGDITFLFPRKFVRAVGIHGHLHATTVLAGTLCVTMESKEHAKGVVGLTSLLKQWVLKTAPGGAGNDEESALQYLSKNLTVTQKGQQVLLQSHLTEKLLQRYLKNLTP